jgi:capsular polysaccharide biosynthesis protein
MSVIEGARVYPGNVQSRDKTSHTGGQLVLDANFALTETSWCVMDGRKTLPTDVDIHAPSDALAGDHYFLGSVHPHFGHVLLEGLARTWGLDAFAARYPQGRVVIHEPWTPDFAMVLLELAGLEPHRLLRPARPIQIERLHVPSIAAFGHRWISTEQARTWRRIGDALHDGRRAERRVYLSRRGIAARSLIEEAAVEDRFEDAGFEIVRPETLPIEEQVRLARSAQVLAGCVGSQMYLAAFQPPGATTLVLAPSNFFLPDDDLIARAMDHQLAVAFGGPSAYRMPQGPWSIDPDAATALIATLEDHTAKRPRPSPGAAVFAVGEQSQER